jgi:hypothetical protein
MVRRLKPITEPLTAPCICCPESSATPQLRSVLLSGSWLVQADPARRRGDALGVTAVMNELALGGSAMRADAEVTGAGAAGRRILGMYQKIRY